MIHDPLGHAGAWWLVMAGLLGVAELLLPGVFLVFLAIAAAIMGAFLLLFPDLSPALQLVGFAAWTALAVLVGRRWYHDFPVEAADPLLNDRAARLVGEVVTVSQPIDAGQGRVRVADGEWPARGPDCPVGTRVRIVGVSGTALSVEPVTTLNLMPPPETK